MRKKHSSICPKCDCQVVARVHRHLVEKIRTRKKKYRCAECKSEFFHQHGTRG